MNIKAKDKIADALVQLLLTTPYTKITVRRLIETASVNKSTYYYNFSTIDDVILYLENRFITAFEHYIDKGLAHPKLSGDDELLVTNSVNMYHFIYENKVAFNALINSSIRDEFRYTFVHSLMQFFNKHTWNIKNKDGSYVPLSQTELSYLCRYHAYSQYAFLEQWAKRNFEETPEELAVLIKRLSNFCSKDFVLN